MADTAYKGNSYEDYLNHYTELSNTDPTYGWYKDKPKTIEAMAKRQWDSRQKEMEKERKAQEKQLAKDQKAEEKRRASEKENFENWSKSLDMTQYHYDDDSGNIIDSKTGKPITEEQRNTFISNSNVAGKNLKDISNYANSSIYRIGSQDTFFGSIGKAAKEGLSQLFGGGSEASPKDLANYMNSLVEDGKATLPPGKKEYTKEDAEALLAGGISQYNGYFVPTAKYEELQKKSQEQQTKNEEGKSIFAQGKNAADSYFAGNQTALQKAQELASQNYTDAEIRNYFEGLYSGKGGLTKNAEDALKNYKTKKEPVQQAASTSISDVIKGTQNAPKEEDKTSLTGGNTQLGAGIDKIYNDMVNENQKENIENTIQRYNKGFKSTVGDSWKDELKDAFGAKMELLKERPIETIADYLGSVFYNINQVINKGTPDKKSMLKQVQDENLIKAIERQNEKKDKMVENDIALLGGEYAKDQELKWQLNQLYANKELMRKIQNLDVENRKALLQAYKQVADSGVFGNSAEEIITNVLKIGATQGAMEGGLPQILSQLVGAAGTAVGGVASGLGSAVGTVFSFIK